MIAKGPKIFVGEWATREGSPTTNINAALGDAAWMTGMERNSDVVIMASYAPLFVNVNPGGMQWASNLIGYDALTSYGSPSYYAQKMFNTYLGDSVISDHSRKYSDPDLAAAGAEGQARCSPAPALPPPPSKFHLSFSSQRRTARTGMIYLKVVNTAGTPQAVQINLKGAAKVTPEGTLVTLSSADPAIPTRSPNRQRSCRSLQRSPVWEARSRKLCSVFDQYSPVEYSLGISAYSLWLSRPMFRSTAHACSALAQAADPTQRRFHDP